MIYEPAIPGNGLQSCMEVSNVDESQQELAVNNKNSKNLYPTYHIILILPKIIESLQYILYLGAIKPLNIIKTLCDHIVTQFMDVLFDVIQSRTLLENLLSVIVTHSSVLLTSPDTPARVWHLRWTQLTITMWCSANLPTAWWAE